MLTAIHEPRMGEKMALGTRQSFSTPKQPGVEGELPVPPKHLRMGYAESEDEFLESGQATARNIGAMLSANDVQLGVGRNLDWGCASGRVMRWFREEGRSAPFWGTDRDADCMAWAKENLSPPFEFVTCSSLPHLPFEDRYFRLLWGMSVFTHIDLMFDTWMMEVRRVLEPGGHDAPPSSRYQT